MAIPVNFLTTLIKKSSVVRRYSGGIDAFRSDYPNALEDSYLFGLIRMSGGDSQSLSYELKAKGLDPQRCCAFADMMLGPLQVHPHFSFRNLNDDFPPKWEALLVSDDPDVLAEDGAKLLSWLMANEMRFDVPNAAA